MNSQPDQDTIVGLSSGGLPSGVAIIRVSGPHVRDVLASVSIGEVSPRVAHLRSINVPGSMELLDHGLVLFFPGPASFTGEDVVEFQLHGGLAVVSALLKGLTGLAGVRLAEAGEFSRRAFEYGRLDLTEVEGLADLISAETEEQRKLAVRQTAGEFRRLCEGWRSRMLRALAFVEAEFDFSDEDDVPDDMSLAIEESLSGLQDEISSYLADGNKGEIIREGFRVALAGPPNSGKSSLLNTLAKRDVAIVSETAGTTRDVIEVALDLGGYKVLFFDTAGIRDTEDAIEAEGIRRTRNKMSEANLVVWLSDYPNDAVPDFEIDSDRVLSLISKDDKGLHDGGLSVSSLTGHGIDALIELIVSRVGMLAGDAESTLINRERHRQALEFCVANLAEFSCGELELEVRAEFLRAAVTDIGRLTGKVDVEELLGVIFSEFCVGK